MIYVFIAIAALALTAALVFLRSMMRRHVASLFRSTVRKRMAGGTGIEQAMLDTLKGFIRRPPFNLLKADEVTAFISILQDLGSPVDVAAEILQECENWRRISELQDSRTMVRLAYATDLRIDLQDLMNNAKILHKKVTRQYPNITIALLASISSREGWTFVGEQKDALIFDYRSKQVLVPKQGSGKDAARLILFEEMVQRPMLERQGTDLAARKSARQNMIDSFDDLFDEVFLRMAKTV